MRRLPLSVDLRLRRRRARPPAPEYRRLPGRWRWLAVSVLVLLAMGVLGGGVALVVSVQTYFANLRLRQGLPEFSLPSGRGPLLVLAPHPDDEALGCAGLIQQALRRGREVYVVLMTNGDASEMALLYEREVRRTATEYLALGARRRQESQAGLGVCGVRADHLYSLGYPNGGLDYLYRPQFWRPSTPWTSPRTRVSRNPYPTSYDHSAVYCGEQVVRDLADLVRRIQPEMVLTSAAFDSHPDHWATWGFTQLALAQAYRGNAGRRPEVYGYLVHRPDWPAPRAYLPEDRLAPPASLVGVPYLTWYVLPLTPGETRVKARAVGQYRSQAPHWDWLMVSLVRANELFVSTGERRTHSGMVLIEDPATDLPRAHQRPGGDLLAVAAVPGPSQWTVQLTAAANLDPALTYCLLGHGSRGDNPFAWMLSLKRGQGTLTWAEGRNLRSSSASCVIRGATLEAQVPAEQFAGTGVFLEAYTALGARYVDHTVTARVPVIPPRVPPDA